MLPLILLLALPARAQDAAAEDAAAEEEPPPVPSELPPPGPPFDLTQAPAPQAAPQRGRVRVVYTGDLGGVGSGNYLLESVRDLRAVDARLEGDVTELRVISGVLASGELSLHAEDGKVETILSALDGAGPDCGEPVEVLAVQGPADTLIFDEPGRAALVDLLEQRDRPVKPWTARSCTTAAGAELRLFGPPGAEPPAWTLEQWELRRGVSGVFDDNGVQRHLHITALPIQEFSRLFTQARALLDQDPDAIFVDAGSFLDGASSVRNDRLSLHRGLGWDTLQRLQPGALVPGEHELTKGAAVLKQELESRDLPYVATNWQAPEALEFPDHVLVEVPTAVGLVRVAFIGIVDPELATVVPQLTTEGITITDPVDGVQPTIDALYASETPPDAVFALTSSDGAVLTRIRYRLRGVDLIAGDPSFATLRVKQRDIELRDLPAHKKGAPLTLSLDGLATADLVFDGAHRLTDVVATPWLIQTDLPRDPAISRAVDRVRADEYPRLDRPLIPAADPDDPVASWTHESWAQLVCEAIRKGTGADAVLLREQRTPDHIPGPLTELLAVDQLAMLDQLEVHRVPGDVFQAVLDKAYGAIPVACGVTLGQDAEPRGRAVDGLRTYKLVTTDRTRLSTPLGAILDGVAASGPLDPKPLYVPKGQKGKPWTLRAATLQSLRDIREGHDDPDQAIYDFLEDYPGSTPPLWLLRIRGISASIDRFKGTENSAFASVPETLATSPSSLTLELDGDVALEYSDAGVTWDLRYRQAYASLTTADTAGQETEDDVRASTSVELPVLAFPRKGVLPWSPYSEVLYDTELDPTLDDTGAENPMQSDLSLTVGLSAASGSVLDTLRVGAFVNRDLAQLADKPTEWGGKAELETSVGVGFADWVTTAEGHLYANTPEDDASDLRFKALAETGLDLPLARWLDISLSAQGFALQGRVPANDELGFAWTLGAALQSQGAFEL